MIFNPGTRVAWIRAQVFNESNKSSYHALRSDSLKIESGIVLSGADAIREFASEDGLVLVQSSNHSLEPELMFKNTLTIIE